MTSRTTGTRSNHQDHLGLYRGWTATTSACCCALAHPSPSATVTAKSDSPYRFFGSRPCRRANRRRARAPPR